MGIVEVTLSVTTHLILLNTFPTATFLLQFLLAFNYGLIPVSSLMRSAWWINFVLPITILSNPMVRYVTKIMLWSTVDQFDGDNDPLVERKITFNIFVDGVVFRRCRGEILFLVGASWGLITYHREMKSGDGYVDSDGDGSGDLRDPLVCRMQLLIVVMGMNQLHWVVAIEKSWQGKYNIEQVFCDVLYGMICYRIGRLYKSCKWWSRRIW